MKAPGKGFVLLVLAVLLLQLSFLLTQPASKSCVEVTIAHQRQVDLRRSSSTAGPADAINGHSTQQSGCRTEVQQHAEAVLAACPGLPGYCVRDASQHVTKNTSYLSPDGPEDAAMRQQKVQVDRFVRGPGLQARLKYLQQLPDVEGILMSVGRHHLGMLTTTLHALRRQYNCTLPIEIAYRGDAEVDPVTRATLTREFATVYWLDLDVQEYPEHHHQNYTIDRFETKVYALYHSCFQKVLLLDADNIPLRDPSYLFAAPQVKQHGMMYWLDFWNINIASLQLIANDKVYPMLGLDKDKYWEVLSAGQGGLHRSAESGQLVIDRVKNADVLEYLWWITSFSSVLYKLVLGDKDTFGFAFAMADKLHNMYAVPIPPGAAFHHGHGWTGQGMLQYDHLGQPLFLHRTLSKWTDIRSPPPVVHAVTGPLPDRFIEAYFNGNKRIYHMTMMLPAQALRPVEAYSNCPHSPETGGNGAVNSYVSVPSDGDSPALSIGGCPLTMYMRYKQVRDLGVPVSRQPGLEEACDGVFQHLQQMQLLQPTAVEAAGYSTGLDGPSKHAGPWHPRQLHQPSRQTGGQLEVNQHIMSSVGNTTCNAHSLWSGLKADVWLQACRSQRLGVQQAAARGSPAKVQGGLRNRRDITVTRRGASAMAVSAASLDTDQNLQACEGVDWSIARHVLHNYAETGDVVRFADTQLPILSLQFQATKGGQKSHMGNNLPDGDGNAADLKHACSLTAAPYSALDHLQLHVMPAATAWLKDHLDELPALQQQRQ